MAQEQDAPVGLFNRVYSLVAWASVAFMVLILVWLVWLLFTLTPAGTARSQELERVRPTQTALAAAYSGITDGVNVAFEFPATCAACHAIAGTSAAGSLCPDLTHIATVSAQRLADPGYAGSATTVEEYLLESIVEPNAYVVQGPGWVTPAGDSTMPAAVGLALTDAELERLVRYLASLE
jgi:mono/diheme cytochrome c family protein